MSVALELYNARGVREPKAHVFIDELNASHFETQKSRSVSIRGRPSIIFEVVRNVQLEEHDGPVDVLKVRPKPN